MRTVLFIAITLTAGGAVAADDHLVKVSDDAGLRQALREAKAGSRIVVAPGEYRPGLNAANLSGTADDPIIFEAADPKDRPVIRGGEVALHLSDCAYLVLRNLNVRGQSGNGINIDDGGTFDSPSHHITLENIHVMEVGPRGNRDAIKLSGVDDLIVRDCVIEGWGGQAIDMVGCHRALIERCTFRGKEGFSQDTGPQAKGGSANVTIRNCMFINAGQRGVNIGGSTDLKLLRPPGANYEARNITVEGCRFVGSMVPIAFVGVDGASVRYNTIYRPERWIVRILQETTAPQFVRCRNGKFERNLVVFRRGDIRADVSVGPNTEPESFTFADNLWFCEDQPARSRPSLPTAEKGGVYNIDPKLRIVEGAPALPEAQDAKGYGAGALPVK